MDGLHPADEPVYEPVVSLAGRNRFGPGQVLLYLADHISCDLGSQYREIVGGYHEKNTDKKAVPVFPEIFVKCREMLQPKKFRQRYGAGRYEPEVWAGR